jgi:histone H3/H4
MTELLVVKAKLKEAIGDFNVAGDLAEELDKIVRDVLKKAAVRAEANGRRTVMAKDL